MPEGCEWHQGWTAVDPSYCRFCKYTLVDSHDVDGQRRERLADEARRRIRMAQNSPIRSTYEDGIIHAWFDVLASLGCTMEKPE